MKIMLLMISISFTALSSIMLTMQKMIIIELSIYSMNSIDVSFFILIDWMSSIFMTTVSFISYAVFMYSEEYMSDHVGRYSKLSFAFVMSMILMILSPNLLSISLGWDMLGLTSFCLVVYYQSFHSYRAGMMTVLINRMGDVFIILSLALTLGIWSHYTILNYPLLSYLIMSAAMTKSAQIPFSAWLPAAMAAPTPTSALVHSSTLVTAGVYLLIRFNFAIKNYMLLITIMSLMTMIMAGLAAVAECDMKKIVAYSTLSQLGFMSFSLSIGLMNSAFFHLIMHAFLKALMFLCVGTVIHGFQNNQDFRMMGGLSSPMVNVSMLCASMCLMGFPFTCAFYSKDLIIEQFLMFHSNISMFLLLMSAMMLTIMYSSRLIMGTMACNYNNQPMTNFKEYTKSNMGIMLLMIGAIGSGGFLQWILIFPTTFLGIEWKTSMMWLMLMFVISTSKSKSWNLDQMTGSVTLPMIKTMYNYQNDDNMSWEEYIPNSFMWSMKYFKVELWYLPMSLFLLLSIVLIW